MHFYHRKKIGAIILSGVLVCSLSACRNLSDRKPQEVTTESTQVKQSNPDYVQADVVLPRDFGNMIYPMEALMVESYSKGLPYYTESSSEEEKDSFWFSMAVLTSQMNHYVRDVAAETDDRYIYIDEETTSMYASSMYDAFGKGNMEFPDRGEDSAYVTYNQEKGYYGFRQGTIGDLEPYVTDCQEMGDEYVLTVHLKNKDSAEVLSSYEITIVPTSFESEENAFVYSVKDLRVVEKEVPENSSNTESEETEEAEDTEESSAITEDTQEDTEDTADQEEETEGSDIENPDISSTPAEGSISSDDALALAKDYYGEDADYSYKETITIGDYDYYDFSVSGEDISATDVLISVDGQNVIGGTQNSDGSWSFDQ